MFCCNQYEKNHRLRQWLLLSYAILFMVSIIRFDIGNDYDGYVESIEEITKYAKSGAGLFNLIIDYLYADIAYVFLCWACSWLPIPFLGVYFLISVIDIYLLYKVCQRYNIHSLGLIFFIISGYLFITWDGARQGVAIMIFMFSLRFIEERKLAKYLMCIIIASLFHKSSLFLLPSYFVSFFSLSNKVYVLIILSLLLVYWFGAMDDIQTQSLDLLSYAGDYYSKYSNPELSSSEGITSVTFKLRMTIKMAFWALIICRLPAKMNYQKNMLLIGVLFAIISNGGLTILRVSWFFLAVGVVSMPLVYQFSHKQWRLAINAFLLMLFFLFSWDVYNVHDNGCTPYDTIFSSNFENRHFRDDNW